MICCCLGVRSADQGLPGGAGGKEAACQCRGHKRLNSIPGSGRSPGGELGSPFHYSCLENPIDRGAWWATVHGVTVEHGSAAAVLAAITWGPWGLGGAWTTLTPSLPTGLGPESPLKLAFSSPLPL